MLLDGSQGTQCYLTNDVQSYLVHNGLTGQATDVELQPLLAHCVVPLLLDKLSEDEHLALKFVTWKATPYSLCLVVFETYTSTTVHGDKLSCTPAHLLLSVEQAR